MYQTQSEVANHIAAALAAFEVFPEIAIDGDWDAYTRNTVEILNFDIDAFDVDENWVSDFEQEFASAEASILAAHMEMNQNAAI